MIISDITTWLGILFCVSQSAMFSGLNLAFFSITRLRLEVEVSAGNKNAAKVLKMRHDSNFLLTTILWGNVGINVLLTLLSDSVMAGLTAFVFSTVVITLIGEILPQAYFSRHALKMAALLSPILRFYQLILYPVAKPVAVLLDWSLGNESIQYFRENLLRDVIKKHVESSETDLDRLEGIGALNFLEIDDILVSEEGEQVDPKSILKLKMENGRVTFPKFKNLSSDEFLKKVHASEKKWVILVNDKNYPELVLDADGFLRAAFFDKHVNPNTFCHRPIVVKNFNTALGDIMSQLKVQPEHKSDDVIDNDLVLVWGQQKRVITGADILGRLMRGIAKREALNAKGKLDSE